MPKPSAACRPNHVRRLVPVFAILVIASILASAHFSRLSLPTFLRRSSLIATSSRFSSSAKRSVAKPQTRRIHGIYAALPLGFEPNQGQTDPHVKYMARGGGYTLFLTNSEAVFSFISKASSGENSARRGVSRFRAKRRHVSQRDSVAVMRMRLVNGNGRAQAQPSDSLPGKMNYYLGNDPKKWHTGVPQFARVSYKSVYPGVDLTFYGQQSTVEFDLIVAPGSSPAPIDLAFSGAQRMATDGSGNLVVSSGAGDVVLHKPSAYQEKNGSREAVDARFVLQANHQVGFDLGSYDHSRELVIDPSVTYATYLGGAGEDEAYAVAVDSTGAYVTGATNSPAFPGSVVAGPNFDAFVTKLDPSGTLIYSTLVGGNAGNGDNLGLAVAVNSTGTYVIGNTTSSNFPASVTVGPSTGQDVFVAKLDNTTGLALKLTRIGGTGTDSGNGIAVDSTGAAYIGGETDSTDFPTAGPPIQTSNAGNGDGFIAKLDVTGNFLDYSNYIGGSLGDLVTGIAIDGSNNAYVTGITVSSNFPVTTGSFQASQAGTADNAFVSAVKADGSAFIYSTYLGGSGTTDATGIAVDSAGEAYVTGDTSSSAFPTLNPAQASLKGATDVFITKFNASGSGLIFSTYFGGTLDDTATGIALDSLNDPYVTGRTQSSDYPTSGSPAQTTLSGTSDAFVTELSNTGFTVYSSLLGGSGNENSVAGDITMPALGAIAVDAGSNAYLAGSTNSSDFPVTASSVQSTYGGNPSDGFVAKVAAAPADYSVAVSPATISVTSGQTTATITVSVSSVNAAFGSGVTLSCGGKPTDAACNFSAASVTPGATAVTSNLTISTNGSTGNGMLTPPMQHRSVFFAMLLPFGGLGIVVAGFGYQRKRFLGTVGLICTVAILVALPACGGGSSGSGGGGGGGGGGGSTDTTPGTYSLTVTGTAGGTSHSAPLALTVQ